MKTNPYSWTIQGLTPQQATDFLICFWSSIAGSSNTPTKEQALDEWTDRSLEIRSRYDKFEGEVIIYTHGSTPDRDKRPLPDSVVSWLRRYFDKKELRRLEEEFEELLTEKVNMENRLAETLPIDWRWPNA